MPYCKNCGEEIPRGATFCSKCGARVEEATDLVLATWGERLIAYIIDTLLLGIAIGWLTLPGLRWMPHMWGVTFPNWIPFVDFGFRNVVYFVYWMFLEQMYGQSVGKMAMKIRVADLDGGPLTMQQAAVQSIGKAFLLPLDLILGWFLYPSKQQRLFNNLSETVVLKKYD
ncbi:zinc-ribbon domain-containing protein [Candidatus Bathyarchaeota archaeon]|nr:MAG: zinc-ribbon domain-containing protein [Candidatus Bathyarchaeota archaeon]